ncbi:glycosyltransferase-like protein LARGE [Schistosoma bovis]|uniref:Glycosyltransferase-like protein LARGE n=1 Tax=Schistosoma bovis TaxID=6184 RepID=A0A430Q410_SCHBO|nr:glycosyltransferase-like protein LARGE [Schistosoma bovis]
MYQPYYDFHNDTIHIAMLLADGIDNCYQAETQIKSILFHQKRWYPSKDDCCHFKHFTHINSNWLTAIDRVQSFNEAKRQRFPIVFHLIVDQLTYEFMNRLMSDWGLDGISVQFYPIKNYEAQVKSFKSGHYSGHKSYLKLLITQILPTEIKKGYGYNAGILLIHLTKLRARGWDEIWMKTAFNLMREKRILPTGEQDVINAVLNRNKRWLYEIPCKWNIQLSAFSMRERCPVVWEFLLNRDDDNNNDNNNYIRKKALRDDIVLQYPNAKLIHFNAHVKPEYFFPTPLRFPLPFDKSDEYHSSKQQ